MGRSLWQRLMCRLTDCPRTYGPEHQPAIVRRMDEIPQRIDRMIERKRANLIEQAYLRQRPEGASDAGLD